MTRPGGIVVLLLGPALAACGGVDVEQARICERLIPPLEEKGAAFEVVARKPDPAAGNAVIVRYRVWGATGTFEDHWLNCRFGGTGFEVARRTLIGVATDRKGPLSAVQLHMLRRYWLGRFEAQAVASRGVGHEGTVKRAALVFAQQAVNALVVCVVYALLALAYTLVYAIIGRINLAFGELLMIGAYATLLGVWTLTFVGGVALPILLAAALVLACGVAALYGWTIGYVVFRPPRASGSQAALIATAGLAMFLQESVRLAQGARDRWLQPVLSDSHVIASADGFTLTITNFHFVIVIGLGILFAAHRRLVDHSSFGRAWRATAQDAGMAALCGIAVGRTVAWTFVLGGAYAGVAGWIIALHYGGVGFYMGTAFGFKALAGAIVGGIGSLPGAMLGGALIGLLETFWSAYLSGAYRDLAVFGLLILVLVFRPEGLLSATGGAGRTV